MSILVMLCYVMLCYVMDFICLEWEHHLAYLHYATNASSTNTVLSTLPTLHPTCLLLESAEALTYDITELAPVHFERATTNGETPTLDLPYQLCNFLTKLFILLLIRSVMDDCSCRAVCLVFQPIR